MRLVILGAGGYGLSVSDIAKQSGRYEKIIFLDDNPDNRLTSGRLPMYQEFVSSDTEFYPAFGNNEVRLRWIKDMREHNCRLATIIHSDAYISPTATIEPAVIIMPKACIGTNVVIKEGCIVNLGAIIDHGCILEEGVHIAPGAIVKAENRIPRMMKIDSGIVIQNREYPL